MKSFLKSLWGDFLKPLLVGLSAITAGCVFLAVVVWAGRDETAMWLLAGVCVITFSWVVGAAVLYPSDTSETDDKSI